MGRLHLLQRSSCRGAPHQPVPPPSTSMQGAPSPRAAVRRGTPTHQRAQVPQRSALWPLRRPTPRSTCQGASPGAGRGSRGWAGGRPCCRGARSPPPRPGRCTGTCSCSGRTRRSGTPCRRRRTGLRPELRGAGGGG